MFSENHPWTIGRTLVSGPTGLPGFCRRISTPFPMCKDSWCSSASLKIAAIAGAIRSAVLFSRSAGRSSWPQALPLFSLEIARWTSPGVMGVVSGDGTPVKAGNSITLGSLNCWPKWWVTRSFSSAALQIMRPESSWILSLLAGFLVISWTARNIFAPSWRRSTSEARWSSLTDALSRMQNHVALLFKFLFTGGVSSVVYL